MKYLLVGTGSLVISFVATNLLYPDNPDNGRVCVAIASVLFVFISGTLGESK